MVRTLDPEKSDIALIILGRVKQLFGITGEKGGYLTVSDGKEVIRKVLKSKEYEDTTQKNMDVTIRFKSDCKERFLVSQEFKNFENFRSYSDFSRNEIVLCYKNIKDEIELKMALDRELGMLSLLPEIENKFRGKEEQISLDKKFALASFISCKRSIRPFFSRNGVDGQETLLEKNAKICATYYSKNFGVNENGYPFDIWARYSRDLVEEMSKQVYTNDFD